MKPACLAWGIILIWIHILPLRVWADEPVPVVTTLPVLKDLVQQIGKTHVRVTSLLTGLENEHSYSPRPSDLIAVRKARVLVQIGAGLEVWVDGLIRSAGNREMTIITAADGVDLLDSHAHDPMPRFLPTVHGHVTGNPHIWLDPYNLVPALSRITETLSRLDPTHASEYSRNHAAYLEELRRLTAELIEQLDTLQDRRIITHHPAWPYFARRFQFRVVGEIQTQSGAEPSPRHMQALIQQIRRDHIRVIVSEPQLSQRLPRLLAQEAGARVVLLTPLPGGIPGTDTYLDMLRYNVLQLLRAFDGA
ncbi:ABC transporter substrate-binding protein [Nitrospira sp.]|nr:ABC transporter substrate-binding protein [Nitrospira sp.]